MRSTYGRAAGNVWIWPAAAVAGVAILAFFGRYLVWGLALLLALAFGLALVALITWLLVGLARPGPMPALPDLARDAATRSRHVLAAARVLPLQAPWRGPHTVLRRVATQLERELAALPSGPCAYSALEVGLSERTWRGLDSWMPIEDVATVWAHSYAQATTRLPRRHDMVTVLIVLDDGAPIGRARTRGSFRELEHPCALARACHVLQGPDHRAAGDRHPNADLRVEPSSVLGVDPTGSPLDPPTAPSLAATTRLDHDSTVRLAAAGSRPTGDATTRDLRLRPQDATLELVPLDPATGLPSGAPALIVRGLLSTIGRDRDSTLRLSSPHVSRRHAEVRRTATGWMLTDTYSTHGTYLNDQPVSPGIPHPVTPGDVVQFARRSGGVAAPRFRISSSA